EDERDNVPVIESVRRLEYAFGSVGKTNHQIVVVPGTGHSVMDREGRLVPGFTDALASWLKRYVLAAAQPAKR
ncbi:MAG TPA: hypothetical protein VEG34_01070, partial [Thermoanaerobaculia bacterium]|nr:hypothetical protein [Thermoanaerobaculia bacterium]